jgi:hypothetical protein
MVLFPDYPVKKESDKYFVYKDREGLLRMDTKRADGDESREFDFKPSTENYACQEMAMKKLLTTRTMSNSDQPTKLKSRAVRVAKEYVDGDHEHDAKAAATDSGITGSTPAVKWDASASVVIEANLDTAKQSITNTSGAIANTLLFDDIVKDVVKKDSTLRNLIRYTIQGSGGQQLLVSGELPPVLFGLKVNVAGARYNTAQKGATASISRIWANHCIVAYVDPNPSIDSMTFGLNFVVRGAGAGGTVVTWFDSKKRGTYYEYSKIQVQKVVATMCGYNLHSVLA